MAGAWPTSRNNNTAAQAYTGGRGTSILSPPMYEFRSDTFTRPTEAMRRVMATAEVGDDVWGEDPTVIALEERAAAAVGKEAAVFVPSGTMGNAIGMRLHAGQGDALWAHDTSHVIDNEGGGPATLWGILPRGIATGGGFFGAGELRELVPEDDTDHHHAIARLVCVENTSTAAQGAPWPVERLAEIRVLRARARHEGAHGRRPPVQRRRRARRAAPT